MSHASKQKAKIGIMGTLNANTSILFLFWRKSGRGVRGTQKPASPHAQHTATPGISVNNGAVTFNLQWNALFTTCSGWNKEFLVKSSFLHSFSSTHAHHLRMWSFTLHCILKDPVTVPPEWAVNESLLSNWKVRRFYVFYKLKGQVNNDTWKDTNHFPFWQPSLKLLTVSLWWSHTR